MYYIIYIYYEQSQNTKLCVEMWKCGNFHDYAGKFTNHRFTYAVWVQKYAII